MEMIKFFFRTGLILIFIGVIGTLTFQFLFTSNDKVSSESVDGPAERVGEVVDRGISGLGKITERVGQQMQKATTEEQEKVIVDRAEESDDIHRRN